MTARTLAMKFLQHLHLLNLYIFSRLFLWHWIFADVNLYQDQYTARPAISFCLIFIQMKLDSSKTNFGQSA